ncbi:hypothetical protein LCGC14_0405590 [marine sediment metagenome]|uniref:Uncharacterized protein n=1 Tax=marine sediment metagenome TaxID=412755 RepID=A0A0F9SVL2_9ZZZZ|nr:hypothetical protein [archaeon]
MKEIGINETALAILANYHSFCKQNEVEYGKIVVSNFDYGRKDCGCRIRIFLDGNTLEMDCYEDKNISFDFICDGEGANRGEIVSLKSLIDVFEDLFIDYKKFWTEIPG